MRFLYSAVHSLSLAALKIVAFLQLPARAFSGTYVRRFPLEEFKPECLHLTVKHLLKIMICSAAWLIVMLDIVDGAVNVTRCIGILLKCVVLYQHSFIPVSVLFEGRH